MCLPEKLIESRSNLQQLPKFIRFLSDLVSTLQLVDDQLCWPRQFCGVMGSIYYALVDLNVTQIFAFVVEVDDGDG
jgi:hypothetical protein